jgi:N utilization substance protein B
VDAVFAADLRKLNPLELLQTTEDSVSDRQNQTEIFEYARKIVDGLVEKYEEVDDAIDMASHQWKIDRMPTLDRAILRVATWEILFEEQVPDAVAISEAVELAKEYSTEDSSGFINGVLNQIASTKTAI